jgi:hypothetical protein
MATISKTFTENWMSSYKSTWTVTCTSNNMTIGSSNTFTYTIPTVTAKYVYSGKNRGNASIDAWINAGGTDFATVSYSRGYGSMASGTTYTLSKDVSSITVYVSAIFNKSNSTSITANAIFKPYNIYLTSEKYSSSTGEDWDNAYQLEGALTNSWGTIATYTLDAPPDLS